MLKVGITGDTGAGKSYICDIFAERGVPIYNCDRNSKLLVISNDDLRNDIKKHFGENIYEGNVFKNLSSIVFSDDSNSVKNLKILTDLIYPYLYNDLNNFCSNHAKNVYCLIESAVLFENKMEDNLDLVIYVYVDLKTRIKRAVNRDKSSVKEYNNRMKNQIDPDIKKEKSDFIIHNDGNNDFLHKRIDTIHSALYRNFEHD